MLWGLEIPLWHQVRLVREHHVRYPGNGPELAESFAGVEAEKICTT